MSKKIPQDPTTVDILNNLYKIYNKKLLPLEKFYEFEKFHSTTLGEGDFLAKPLVLLIGQYSTGKTTFIRYLLEEDFPGMRIGPEPTTDRFVVIMHNDNDTNSVIPGQAAVSDPRQPFRGLNQFGNSFLNRFQCSLLKNEVLKSITLIDTPGILSGEKQRVDRGYDFTTVIEWFAQRVDIIILLFDAHKLDISDEFKRTIDALKNYDNKIRIMLNKADMVNPQQLMNIYGALLWSLGKVLNSPEVPRVYMGSFWDQPLHFDDNRKLFQMEEAEFMNELKTLPANAALRKINDLIRRARLAKVHAYIIGHLKQQMPFLLRKEKKKLELIAGLDEVFHRLAIQHKVSEGDFPRVKNMQVQLESSDFSQLNSLKPKLIEVVDNMLSVDIPNILQMIPKLSVISTDSMVEFRKYTKIFDVHLRNMQVAQDDEFKKKVIKGGIFSTGGDENPFSRNETGINMGKFQSDWVVTEFRSEYDKIFDSLGPNNGLLTGQTIRDYLIKSKLPVPVLSRVWKLSDVDEDGYLDREEFALALYLVKLKLGGDELPLELPKHLVPPAKMNKLKTDYS